MPISNTSKKKSNQLRILAMAMIGGGLLIFGLAAMILIPSFFPSSSQIELRGIDPVRVDYPAPNIQLKDIFGTPVSLEEYRGQVVLVNNWATWCPPCRQEMPILDAYFREYKDQDFVIVAIDAGDSAEMVEEFVNRYKLTFPVWIDPSSSALNSFRNNYLPSSYLIDKQGQVVMVWSGAVTYASLEDNITPLLKD